MINDKPLNSLIAKNMYIQKKQISLPQKNKFSTKKKEKNQSIVRQFLVHWISQNLIQSFRFKIRKRKE